MDGTDPTTLWPECPRTVPLDPLQVRLWAEYREMKLSNRNKLGLNFLQDSEDKSRGGGRQGDQAHSWELRMGREGQRDIERGL